MSEQGTKGFFDPAKVATASLEAAENELHAAIEAERPDELAPPLEGADSKKQKGFIPDAEDVPAIIDGVDWKSRYGNLQRYIDKTLKPKFKGEIDTLTTKLTKMETQIAELSKKGAPADLPQSVEEIEALKKENPAAFSAIVALATTIAEGVVKQKVSSLETGFEDIKKGQKENKEAAAMIALKARHSDFDALAVDAAFHEWLQGQSKVFQDALYGDSLDVDAADSVIKMYKAVNGITPGKGKGKGKKVDTNLDVNTPSAPELPTKSKGWDFTESELAAMSSSVFDKKQEQIDKAIREGRILKDMSDPIGSQRMLAAQDVG